MYVSKRDIALKKAKYYPFYQKYNHGLYKIIKRKHIKKYLTVEKSAERINANYLNKQLIKNKVFFDNINGYSLDKYQRKIVLSEEDSTLVVAGAGSGKSLTILGRIMYLIKSGVDSSEILCISFTNAASYNLQKSLLKNGIEMRVITFHKLGMEILRDNNSPVNMVGKDVLYEIITKNLKSESKIQVMLPDLKFNIQDDDLKEIQNQIILNSEYIKNLEKLFLTFINLFKSNNFQNKDFDTFLEFNKKEKDKYTKSKNEVFLSLARKIYDDYTYYLKKNREIDFHDMINKATNLVLKKGCRAYKYIIVDEYQDASLVKCELVKAIKDYTESKLLVVGDDFQSIYRFTGSNLKVFTDFKRYFNYSKIFKLENTYRNSEELLKIMSKFILKNKNQMKKDLKSDKHNLKPIYIYYYDKTLGEVWEKVMEDISGEKFIVLGRNNLDGNLLKEKSNYMTVHKSKGLEADNTVIINLENKVLGFPNKIVNDDVLKYVIAEDIYPYEEERRLFYVALTRTKNNNYLLVNKNKPSIFISELLKDSFKYIKIVNKIIYCPKCGKVLMYRRGKKGLFYGCTGYPQCNYTRKII